MVPGATDWSLLTATFADELGAALAVAFLAVGSVIAVVLAYKVICWIFMGDPPERGNESNSDEPVWRDDGTPRRIPGVF